MGRVSVALTSDSCSSSNLGMDSNRTPLSRARSIWLINLFFGPGLAPTGVLLESLAMDLHLHGWHVEVLAGTADYRAVENRESSCFPGIVHRFHCQSKQPGTRGKFWTWLWFYVQVAWFALWRRMPDVILVQTTPPFLHTIFTLRCLFTWRRRELILWNQDTYPETLIATRILREKSLAYRCLNWIAHWSGRRITRAVALDGAMAERLGRQGIKNVRIIPNWDVSPVSSRTDLLEVQSNPRQLDALPDNDADSRSLPTELTSAAIGYRYRIAYTGNLGIGHDLTPLWNFIAQHPTQSDFLFLFVGEGDRTRELKSMIERNGWKCVKFWPYLPASQFDAFLNWADWGLVALEPNCLGLMSPSKLHAWLRAGKPVLYIGPEGSNVTETVRAYDCGFVADPQDPQSFEHVAEKILKISFDSRQMGLRARQAWHERHTSTVGLSAWRELLPPHDSSA
ncbi:MAG: putative colanic acid biosynthesis glycosyl transferase [Planctomycetaceae bacterium]|nr:putative colanic acid biosynthesis glycosyl transferase [Planctomycetaceae bacterium]